MRRESRRSPKTGRHATSSRTAPGSYLPAAARSGNPPRRQRCRRAPSPAGPSRRCASMAAISDGCAASIRASMATTSICLSYGKTWASSDSGSLLSRLTMLRKRSVSIWYSNSRSTPSSDRTSRYGRSARSWRGLKTPRARLDGANDERFLKVVVAQQADRAWHVPARGTRWFQLRREAGNPCSRA